MVLCISFDYCGKHSLNCHLKRKPVLSVQGWMEVQQFVFRKLLLQEMILSMKNSNYWIVLYFIMSYFVGFEIPSGNNPQI